MSKLINNGNGGPMMDLTDNYQNLVNAVILSGVSEYRTVRRRLNRQNAKLAEVKASTIDHDSLKQEIQRSMDELHSLERFFRTSEWFSLLPNVTGEYILVNLEAEFKPRESKRYA